jgi:hypothetical protein
MFMDRRAGFVRTGLETTFAGATSDSATTPSGATTSLVSAVLGVEGLPGESAVAAGAIFAVAAPTAGIVSTEPQAGQRIFRPAKSSRACKGLPQGQANWIAIFISPQK